MTTPETIVRCLKRDLCGDLLAGARYAERIAFAASMNPWAPAGDAEAYREAALRLRTEHEDKLRAQAVLRMYGDG